MIILAILNFLVGLEYAFVNTIMFYSIPTFDALTLWFTNVSVPLTVYNVLALVTYFLPMGTIHVLVDFTILIVVFKILTAVLHMLSLGKLL